MIDSKLLLPREQYKEEMLRRGRSPYMLEIKKGDQALFYFGANHSRDPDNHQYPILRDYWQKFLLETEGQDRIVLVEGILRIVGTREERSIKDGSEGNLVTMWARDLSILVACPEPDNIETFQQG